MHDVTDVLLLDLQQVFQLAEGDLRLHHPELLEVAAGLAFFSAEGGTEAVGLADREDIRLVVELPRLGQEGRFAVEVGLEQRRRALGRRRGEDRCVHEYEAVVVQPIAHSLDDRGPDAQDRPLAVGAQPQMPVVHQELDAVFLRADRVLGRFLDDLQVGHA